MRSTIRVIVCLFILLAVTGAAFSATRTAAKPLLPPLEKLPSGVRWYGIYFGGERTGFSKITTAETADGYELTVEASVRMVVMGFSREASSQERYLVNRDLSLRSFQVEEVLDGTPLKLAGAVTPKGVKVSVTSGGTTRDKLLKVKGAIYPQPALNYYPLVKGAIAGGRHRIQMLDVEAIKVREIAITVTGAETLPDGTRTIRLLNDLYPMVDNDVWVDLAGNTLKESVRDGLVETLAEDEGSARRFIADAAISRRDLILDFSLVRVEPPLANAADLTRLVLEVEGIPTAMPLLQGGGQSASRTADGRVIFTVEPGKPAASRAEEGAGERFLVPTDRLPVDNPEIRGRAENITGDDTAPRRRVERLVRWVAGYVEDSVTDSPSPLDILKSRKGNCQSHARLYTTLARAAGIPTRFVSGLVYLQGKGFVYHSWAESFVEGCWLQVDPTFGQMPVDATHVKLVEGESPDEMVAIAGVVGKIRARVLETTP
ncbi:MAG: transglutaminase domain-containing protein [Desulfuromonadales bacterium]|nr:MAG: transglutaminase domain-containing protein [Desulfuromonadales bacterium]